MRRRLAEQGFGADRGFRWRGGEISRLGGLSDAVFAFAVTLLAVSLEAPATFDELLKVLRGFFAFAVCFSILFAGERPPHAHPHPGRRGLLRRISVPAVDVRPMADRQELDPVASIVDAVHHPVVAAVRAPGALELEPEGRPSRLGLSASGP